nr:unnamed protein product [Callosobruchus chinensis]
MGVIPTSLFKSLKELDLKDQNYQIMPKSTSLTPISLEDISVDNNGSPDEAQPLRSLRIAQLKDK